MYKFVAHLPNCLCYDCSKEFVVEHGIGSYVHKNSNIKVESMTVNEQFKSGAEKDLAQKLRMDLIPPESDQSYAEVLGLGAGKYEDRNWEKGIPFTVCVGSLKRHLNEWELGNDINTKDGTLNHLQHAQFWINALVTFIKRGRSDLDDRPSKQ